MALWLNILLGVVAMVILLHILFYFLIYVGHGVCTSEADLSGKTALVTGANAGIGYYTALDFATRNATVVLACRNKDKSMEAVRKIKQKTGNTNVRSYVLDTSLMASVRSFVKEFKKMESRLDILVNNAGIAGGVKYEETSESLELVMATNHFGPFLLTNLLLDMLKSSGPSRIVNVSSYMHYQGAIDFEGIVRGNGWTAKMYSNSKMANILFTRELARRLHGTGVTANSLHPGVVNTNIFQQTILPFRLYLSVIGHSLFKTPEQGAQTTIHCAVSEELEGVTGKYFSDCKVCKESKRAQDDGVAKKLWEISEKFTGLTE